MEMIFNPTITTKTIPDKIINRAIFDMAVVFFLNRSKEIDQDKLQGHCLIMFISILVLCLIIVIF